MVRLIELGGVPLLILIGVEALAYQLQSGGSASQDLS